MHANRQALIRHEDKQADRLTIFPHAHTQTLLEPAELTGVPGEFVDVAVARVLAAVGQVLLY